MESINLSARAYILNDPKGKTLAYANITVDGILAVKGIRIVDGQKGLFVAMPQSQDKQGMYHDIAFPLSKELRSQIAAAVLAEFEKQSKLPPDGRGYEKAANSPGRCDGVSLETKAFPLKQPKDGTLAFASVSFNGIFAIRGLRINQTDRGKSVTMPQTTDKEGNPRDVAYPISVDLRRKISRQVLEDYHRRLDEQNQSIGDRLAEGAEAAEQQTQPPAAENSPGLED